MRQYKMTVLRAQKHYNRQTETKDIKRERSNRYEDALAMWRHIVLIYKRLSLERVVFTVITVFTFISEVFSLKYVLTMLYIASAVHDNKIHKEKTKRVTL